MDFLKFPPDMCKIKKAISNTLVKSNCTPRRGKKKKKKEREATEAARCRVLGEDPREGAQSPYRESHSQCQSWVKGPGSGIC